MDPQQHVPATALGVRGLKVRYRNGALGVQDVSLEVAAGQVVALFGPNGAGKTTTVRAVSGFLRSEGAKVVGGSVTLFGTPTANPEPHQTSRLGVAFVAERHKIFPGLSVAENLVALGRLPRRSRRRQITDEVFELFPVLGARPRELAGRLSGGQQQMLAIARGLMSEPRLLIVDELTLGLHHSLHAPLFEAMRRIAGSGKAVLVVDESTGTALDTVDHCYLINGGRIRNSGPAADFRGSELLAAGYVES
ncbi:ABC transporter ATP-binding protein [Plantactinospora sp. KBS50]|uniref:ABC transporter ATP-binding protein n=1 Tax=Plantactinospora sp. KBS50 TaxID=2024580 RepID=UPI000BAAA92C|nr:ATP-binding cassette domain-containing protein [Plantactinospora sp. KBS50]ASW55648.1 hypothetical protein CIK06_17860 [Plantactinospora sp. KBS50]